MSLAAIIEFKDDFGKFRKKIIVALRKKNKIYRPHFVIGGKSLGFHE